MERNFNEWFSTFTDSIATYEYYTDFNKVYRNIDKLKVELNIMNSLIGSKNIEKDFDGLFKNTMKLENVCLYSLLLEKKKLKL